MKNPMRFTGCIIPENKKKKQGGPKRKRSAAGFFVGFACDKKPPSGSPEVGALHGLRCADEPGSGSWARFSGSVLRRGGQGKVAALLFFLEGSRVEHRRFFA